MYKGLYLKNLLQNYLHMVELVQMVVMDHQLHFQIMKQVVYILVVEEVVVVIQEVPLVEETEE